MARIIHSEAKNGLRLVNPLKGTEWDRILQAHRAATLFHGSAWARVIAETYGFRPFYLAAESGEAALCLFEVNSWLTGKRGVGLPFTDECAPLEDPEWQAGDWLQAAIAFGSERAWRTLEIRGGNLSPASASIGYYKHLLDIGLPEETLFSRLDGSVRRAIRKAERFGVTVEFVDDLEGMREYYKLHCKTRQKHGLPPQPFRFFEGISRHVISKKTGFVALARFQNRVVAGAIFLCALGSGHYKFGASDPSFEHVRPNNLVMWRSMLHCASFGLERIDLGRTSVVNSGLRRYKLNWGAQEKLIDYWKWSFRRSAFQPVGDNSEGSHNLFFRRCPASLNRLLGAMLYPHIA